MNIRTIICPQDFTAISSKALDYAALFAQKLSSEIILLHIIDAEADDYTRPGNSVSEDSIQKNIVNEKLESIRQEVERRYGIITRTRIEFGSISNTIAKIGNEAEIDLIVMGTKGAHSISKIFRASDTLKVIEKSLCPVLIVPQESDILLPKKWLFASALEDEFELLASDVIVLSKSFEAKVEVLNVTKKDDETEQVTLGGSEEATHVVFTRIKSEHVLEGLNDYVESANPDLLIVVEHPHSRWDWIYKEDKISRIVEGSNFPVLILQGGKK